MAKAEVTVRVADLPTVQDIVAERDALREAIGEHRARHRRATTRSEREHADRTLWSAIPGAIHGLFVADHWTFDPTTQEQSMSTTPQLGDRARDRITGFEGVVTGTCRYLTGCDQLLLAPQSRDGDFKESHWFDRDRCVVVEAAVFKPTDVSSAERPGPDRPAPKR